ncbi:MAG: bifunctional riboflavin kinase/FAD synthetase [Bacteroidales bacterium]|nr:bifunctional riboflavin kinase/FAD synthetase [Bacteroidales bacterium]
MKNCLLKIYQDLNNFTAVRPVVTIGIFDGLHLGHVRILERLKEIALKNGGETIVVTFWPHPLVVLGKKPKDIKMLSTLNEKISLIRKQGIDNLVILPFTHDFANTPYDKFIRKYLVEGIRSEHIIVGYNHHFGRDRHGGFEQLKKNADKYGFSVEKQVLVIIEKKTVSSSVIRKFISKGDVIMAGKLLGYHYSIEGKVIEGKKLGKSLGYPTANIRVIGENKLIPLSGVYAVKVEIDEKCYNGMMNIGIRPTIAEQVHNLTIEVHILQFNRIIYGENIRLHFIERIRDEKKFKSVEELVEQLRCDEIKTNQIFSV